MSQLWLLKHLKTSQFDSSLILGGGSQMFSGMATHRFINHQQFQMDQSWILIKGQHKNISKLLFGYFL